jgi:hypothetical protein
MNALLRNAWTDGWAAIGKEIQRPKAVLSVSAHWYLPEAGSAGRQRSVTCLPPRAIGNTRRVPGVIPPFPSVSMKRSQPSALSSRRSCPTLPILAPRLEWSNRSSLPGRSPKRGRAKKGLTTFTSNDGPRDVSETFVATGSSRRNPSTMRPASNASAMMISDVFCSYHWRSLSRVNLMLRTTGLL